MNTDDCPKGVHSARDYRIAEMIGRSPEITSWAIDYIQDSLSDYKGSENYGCDLASVLTERPNVNGVYVVGVFAAWDFIGKHIHDARVEYDYEKDMFGEAPPNPFEDTEGFIVRMLINTVDQILSEVPIVKEHWDDDWELDDASIKEILGFLGRCEEWSGKSE